MKVGTVLIRMSVMVLAIAASGVLADPHGKGGREGRKAQMEYERGQSKRDREWEREERRRYRELGREESGYGYNDNVYYEPDYPEDKAYRIIKYVRDLSETLNQ